MADTLVATGTDAKFLPHPEGQHVGQCVDAIDMGHKVEDYPGTPKKLVQKCVLVFRTGERNDETGEYIDIAREFSLSMGEKSNLRKFLEQWRGKPYTGDQIKAGVPLHKLVGQHGLLTITHRQSQKGRTYATITACVGIPKQMKDATVLYEDGYTRADYWQTRKEEYAKEAESFLADQGTDHDDFPAALRDEDDDLPF